MVAIKKHSSKLENWSVEMPNAPYSKRYKASPEDFPLGLFLSE